MGYLFSDNYDQMMLKRRVQQMTEVDRLLALTEAHFGVSLVGEQRVEEMLKKWGEKQKEESSTSDFAEEALAEKQTRLHSYDERQPRLPDHHIGPAVEREPHHPGA